MAYSRRPVNSGAKKRLGGQNSKMNRLGLDVGLRVRRRNRELIKLRLTSVRQQIEKKLKEKRELARRKQKYELPTGLEDDAVMDAPNLLLKQAYVRRVVKRARAVDKELEELARMRTSTAAELQAAHEEVRELEDLRAGEEGEDRKERGSGSRSRATRMNPRRGR